jgi:NADH-quinone oxidoreductase subunit C
MEKEQLKEKFRQLNPDVSIAEGNQYIEVTVSPEKLVSFARQLKEDIETRIDYLINLTGVDWIDRYTVVYHLTSTECGHIIVLKVNITNRDNPSVDTVCNIWQTAEHHEREVFDLFGIRFNNHPDMRRLFLDEDWVGYPLRKDYSDDINMLEL